MIATLYQGRAGFDVTAIGWAAAVTANGGTYSIPTLAALSTFIAGMKTDGLWTGEACFNPMCGNQLAACLVQYSGGVWAPATNVGFVNGDYTEATGLTGNGAKYLNTGLIPSASLTLNDTHLAIYNRSATASGGQCQIGADNAVSRLLMLAPFNDGNIYSDHYNNGTGRITVAAPGTPYGLICATRTSAILHTVYRNGSSIASSAGVGGVLPIGQPIYVFAFNNNGAPSTVSSHILSMYSIGAGRSAAQNTAFYNRVQTFQTALGRQV